MNQMQRDVLGYSLAREFLLASKVVEITTELIEKYLRNSKHSRPDSIGDIYGRILHSAQNANMMPTVIGKAIGGVEKLRPVLCNFDPAAILEKFPEGPTSVLDEIQRELKPTGQNLRNPRSLWPRFCKTILSAAKFMQQFSTRDDFYQWVDSFDKDDRARAALPMLLAEEIYGLGFALACDFLKEMGYDNFGKPDVHLKEMFVELGLCDDNSDYHVFKAIVRVAKNASVTPYNVDKAFWLIGSGFFYDDKNIGEDGKIGGRKKEFIAWAKPQLRSDVTTA